MKYNWKQAYITPENNDLVTQQRAVMPLEVMLARAERGERVPAYGAIFDEEFDPDGDDPDFDVTINDDPFADITDVHIALEEQRKTARQAMEMDPKVKRKKGKKVTPPSTDNEQETPPQE